MPQEWTVKRVKEELPDILVKVDGKVMPGRISGRKLPFPVIWCDNASAEFAWETVCRALNGNYPLVIW